MKTRWLAAALAGGLQAAIAAEAPGDFGFGLPVEGTGAAALYRVAIAPPVYEHAAFADLRDLRVFNGVGELVPHAFHPPARAVQQQDRFALPLFPMRGPAGAAVDDFDIAFDSDRGRAKLRLKRHAGQPPPATLIGYLADVSASEESISGLSLDIDSAAAGYIGSFHVEASDDLKYWRRLASDVPLVSLVQEGQQLEQKTVRFSAQRMKYVRLTWPAGTAAPLLRSLSAFPAEAVAPSPREWKEAAAPADPHKPGEYVLDLGGRFPVDRLVIRLPQRNSVAPLQVFARNEPSEPWQGLLRTVAYRLHQGDKEIVSPEISLSPTTGRYWLLRAEDNHAALGTGSLRVRAGWVTREIVFAARGSGPFLLAFGNARAQPNALAIEALVPGWGTERAASISAASTGALRTLAGANAAKPRLDLKKAGLWSALLAGVILLGWMAWTLSRQLRSGV